MVAAATVVVVVVLGCVGVVVVGVVVVEAPESLQKPRLEDVLRDCCQFDDGPASAAAVDGVVVAIVASSRSTWCLRSPLKQHPRVCRPCRVPQQHHSLVWLFFCSLFLLLLLLLLLLSSSSSLLRKGERVF